MNATRRLRNPRRRRRRLFSPNGRERDSAIARASARARLVDHVSLANGRIPPICDGQADRRIDRKATFGRNNSRERLAALSRPRNWTSIRRLAFERDLPVAFADRRSFARGP